MPSRGAAQAASAPTHLCTAPVQTIPPTASSSTRAVLSYHTSLNSLLAQSLPNWCLGVIRGDGGLLGARGWPERLDVGFLREEAPAPARLGLHFCPVTPTRAQL